MKCPNCGAEIDNNSKICEFCDSQLSLQMRKEQEQLKKPGCPECGSSNVVFNREKQGEVIKKTGTSVVTSTMGICHDCGHTWNADNSNVVSKNSSMVWWVLGWLFFFPAPIMVLIWRKQNKWDIKIKIAITVLFWVLFFIIGSAGNKNNTSTNKASTSKQTTSAKVENTIASNQ